MDCVSPILDVATRLWDCTAKRAVYIHDLQENLDSLRSAMEELKNVAEDVKNRVQEAENHLMRRTHEVDGWLQAVEVMQRKVQEILQNGDQEIQKKCLGTCCPRNCRSSYKIGKIASKKLGAVTELRNKGDFDVVAYRLPESSVEERPMEKTVGLDLMYAEVCGSIQDEKLGIIGLYGMGGAGKTTLMTKVNNEFIKTSDTFEIAIWVVVSKPANVEKLQEVIWNKLGIPDDRWQNRSEDERAMKIFNILKTKRFVMLLDDVWQRLDLNKVGVPIPNDTNKSKIVLTTRSRDVCRHMQASKIIKVECLTPDEAFNLFKEKVGENTLNSHPDICKLAKIAAEECKGLPLALVTIGRAMVGRNSPQEWERAILVLKTYPSNFSGMEDEVFHILKFSYDSLRNETIKSCFLYLSIFPEDFQIMNDALINLWIGEGFLDEFDDLYDARKSGYEIIESLKFACLFENGKHENEVKMHDVIRDMALWINCEYGDKKNKVLVEEDTILKADNKSSKLKEAQRVSILNSRFELHPPHFSNVLTLIVKTRFRELEFPNGFFSFMPVIKVLDLSDTPLCQLPVEIGNLITLQYLNLSRTYISELPLELKNLTNLRCLILKVYRRPPLIPSQVIRKLLSLQLLNIQINRTPADGRNETLLEDLECLDHINEISIAICRVSSLQKLLRSWKLQMAIRWLQLTDVAVTILKLPTSLQRMENLGVSGSFTLEDIEVELEKERQGFGWDNISNSKFHNLRKVSVQHCTKLLNLRWLIHVSSLEELIVQDCKSMESVIHDACGVEERPGVFLRLKTLSLQSLPNLKSICEWALPFPSLTEISVDGCPSLTKLPLDSNSARSSLKGITGEESWWVGLHWKDDTLKHTFTAYFKPRAK